jgi:DNA primase
MTTSQVLYKTTCPNPTHDDSTPSFVVYDDNHGYCYGCQHRTEPVLDAVQWKRRTAQRAQQPEGTNRTIPLPWSLVRQYAVQLQTFFADRREWLWARGLSSSTITLYQLGHTGVAFSIPVWGPNNELLAVKFLNDDVLHPENPPGRKYWGLRGHNQVQLYGTWQPCFGKDLVLCDGELDTLRLLQDLPADRFAVYSSTGGAGSLTQRHVQKCRGANRVFLAFDQDAAGAAGARAAVSMLGAEGIPARTVRWDPAWGGKDVTELLNRRELAAFLRLLKEAV